MTDEAEHKAALRRLVIFVEWVAGHLESGTYADEERPYAEWFTPEGDEAELGEVVDRAREALGEKPEDLASEETMEAGTHLKPGDDDYDYLLQVDDLRGTMEQILIRSHGLEDERNRYRDALSEIAELLRVGKIEQAEGRLRQILLDDIDA